MNTLANSFGSHADYASFGTGKFIYFQPRKQFVQAGYFQLKKIATLLMLSAITSINAFAADQGFYANIDSGIYLYNNAPQSSSVGYRIGGGYQFNPHLGVEAGYSIIDDATSGDCVTYIATLSTCPQETLSASSSQVVVVGTLPLGENHSLFGKLGWANTSLDYSYSYTPCFLVFCDPTITGSGNATKTNPMFGIGWQSSSSRPLYWRVLYENFGTIKMTINYNNQPSTTSDIGIKVISVGLVYKF
jgi:hypothetical protein